jgi:hypothetical protein
VSIIAGSLSLDEATMPAWPNSMGPGPELFPLLDRTGS